MRNELINVLYGDTMKNLGTYRSGQFILNSVVKYCTAYSVSRDVSHAHVLRM